MSVVTQFEVYVLERGRWTLHARYPSGGRAEALRDAWDTEASVQLPTKVIRDSFFPELNNSEQVTIYASAKVKPLSRRDAPRQPQRLPARAFKPRRTRRPRADGGQGLLRILVTAGVSLCFTTCITILVALTLDRSGRFADASDIVRYLYVTVFVLSFLTFLRSRFPLQRLLTELWVQKAADAPSGQRPERRQTAGPIWPKQSIVAPIQERDAGAEVVPAAALSPARDAKAPEETPFEAAGKTATKATADQVPAPPPAQEPVADRSARGQKILQRLVQAQVPEAVQRLPNDEMTWRGIALWVSGAVDAYCDHVSCNAPERVDLHNFAFTCAGLSAAAIASFLNEKPSNPHRIISQPVIAAGGAAMKAEVGGRPLNGPPRLVPVILAWRTALGPAVASLSVDTPPEAAVAPTLVDVLLLAARARQSSSDGSIAAGFDDVVAKILAARGGSLVRQTSAGLFARFSQAAPATEAALEAQQALGDAIAIALIGNCNSDEDPAFSSLLVARAEAVIAAAPLAGVIAEAAVYDAAALAQVTGVPIDVPPGTGPLLYLARKPQPIDAPLDASSPFHSFLRQALTTISADQLNPFARLGLNLYLAGAASAFGQANHLSRDAQLAMLQESLTVAGTSQERARNFCAELPNYRKIAKYAEMIQAGATAMTAHEMDSAGIATLPQLLNAWGLPKMRSSAPSTMTFLFTDIVGSMEMTFQIGNAAAQVILRAHNAVVRAGIEAGDGREVKHTGDGIMAVFPDPASAVKAAIEMQRGVIAHNAANPAQPLNIRIGINAGEAVEEDNDFFGAAVQMTARICDKATKGNIWVSQAIVDACKDHEVDFIPRGHFEVKGIYSTKMLYEVSWTTAYLAEVAGF